MPRDDRTATPPALPGRVIVLEPTALQRCLAEDLVAAACTAVRARGRAHLALSGGSSPEPVYRLLAGDVALRARMPWARTHLWLVDERRVPASDPRSNLRMLRAALAGAPARIEELDATDADADTDYEARLRAAVPDGRLDVVLLGVGADGHTASLFPESPALDDRGRWFLSNDGPTVTPPPRLTMTAPLLNRAERVHVLATGASKRAPLAALAAAPAGGQTRAAIARALPVAAIAPAGELRFYLDPEAAPDGATTANAAPDLTRVR